jgi:hypothetical protein
MRKQHLRHTLSTSNLQKTCVVFDQVTKPVSLEYLEGKASKVLNLVSTYHRTYKVYWNIIWSSLLVLKLHRLQPSQTFWVLLCFIGMVVNWLDSWTNLLITLEATSFLRTFWSQGSALSCGFLFNYMDWSRDSCSNWWKWKLAQFQNLGCRVSDILSTLSLVSFRYCLLSGKPSKNNCYCKSLPCCFLDHSYQCSLRSEGQASLKVSPSLLGLPEMWVHLWPFLQVVDPHFGKAPLLGL